MKCFDFQWKTNKTFLNYDFYIKDIYAWFTLLCYLLKVRDLSWFLNHVKYTEAAFVDIYVNPLCQVSNLFGSFEIRLQNWLDWESALPCIKAIGMLHTHWGTRQKPPYYANSDNQLKSVELCLKLNDPNLFLFLMWWQKLIHFTETSHLVNDRQNS